MISPGEVSEMVKLRRLVGKAYGWQIPLELSRFLENIGPGFFFPIENGEAHLF